MYFLACVFNTMAMMTTCVMFVTAVLLPVSEYIGRYHIMVIVILLAAVLGLGVLVSLVLAVFGMDPSSITTDKVSNYLCGVMFNIYQFNNQVVTTTNTDNVLTAVLRFSQVGTGRWTLVLGSVNIIGELGTCGPPTKLVIVNVLR